MLPNNINASHLVKIGLILSEMSRYSFTFDHLYFNSRFSFSSDLYVSLNFCLQLSGYSEQPVSLLLFIGTADDRYLRPHCFYQVHRVTGKTVTTTCQEKIMECTKVLEIPLLPENNMSAR